jgi:hypothetical protein
LSGWQIDDPVWVPTVFSKMIDDLDALWDIDHLAAPPSVDPGRNPV